MRARGPADVYQTKIIAPTRFSRVFSMADARTQSTFGKPRWQLEAGGFLVAESEFAPGMRTGPHAHAVTSLVFGLRGSLRLSLDHRSWVLRARSLLVLPRGVVHADQGGRSGYVCLVVTPGPFHLERVGRRSSVLESPRLTAGARIGAIGTALRREARVNDGFRPLAIGALVYDMLADLARESDLRGERPAPWLARLRHRLDAEFVAPPALPALASEAGVNPAALTRAFTRRYGESTGAFVRRRRLEWAMRELLRSDEPIARIALAAGFFDQSHFTRHFRRMVGTTPARFRSGAAGTRLDGPAPVARHAG